MPPSRNVSYPTVFALGNAYSEAVIGVPQDGLGQRALYAIHLAIHDISTLPPAASTRIRAGMEDYFHPEPPRSQDSFPPLKRNKSIDKDEAVKRGLSFGPVKSRGRHNSTAGILKPTAGSPPPQGNRRARSINNGQGFAKEIEEGKERKVRTSLRGGSKLAAESSEEDASWSSGDEATESRGRKKEINDDLRKEGSYPLNQASPPRAESVDSQPSIVVTEPEDEKAEDRKTTSKSFHVHPNTNFDKPVPKPATAARAASPTLSEEEELEATARAQALPIYSSNQDSTVPHRAIQTLVRGDFALMQREAKEGLRRLRTYLAATDLSGEAAFALEWTIGTVLRDGDTLYAVYAVDEEVGTGAGKEDGLPIGQGAAAMQETAARMETMTAETQRKSRMSFSPLPKSVLRPSSRKGSAATSTDSRVLSVAQQERLHALNKLQETCLGLLRKTGLQCRVVIEVIHCKSPKYMITEAVGCPLPLRVHSPVG